jgi:hypothetical protein
VPDRKVWLQRWVGLHKISICHFVPPEIRMVGAVVGLDGKLILTVSLRRRRPEPSSPASALTTVPRGGRGGGTEAAGFGSGWRSSFFINAQCCLRWRFGFPPSPKASEQFEQPDVDKARQGAKGDYGEERGKRRKHGA